MFYWCLLTQPLSFGYYTYKHSLLWYGAFPGILIALCYPIMPFIIVLIVAVKKIQDLFVEDWTMAGPGRVFFLKPSNPVTSFIWDCYLNQSMYVGQFILVGTDDTAISHTWIDTILNKEFWRATLDSVDARVPRQIGAWTGSAYMEYHPLGKTTDLVVKLNDSYLGIGDSFWNHGEDYNSLADLEVLLAEKYKGQEALILELVRPKKSEGVHSVDIITMRTPEDGVSILSILFWTDCTTDSSHSTQAGYTIDLETETITAPADWYSAYFTTMGTPRIGDKLPGLKKACEKAVAAHENIEHKWLTVVGWDCMMMEGDEAVFFEGNFAGARVPRRMFMNWTTVKLFVTEYFWPFGTGTSAQPGLQMGFGTKLIDKARVKTE